MFTDSHNHTSHFSLDARMTLEQLIKSARNKNLDAVVITEHYDLENPNRPGDEQIFSFEEYFTLIHDYKKNNPSLEKFLRTGLEVGFQTQLSDYLNQILKNKPFDSIIASAHVFDGIDPYFMPECYEIGKINVYNQYLYCMEKMVTSLQHYQVVGHFDYITRYSSYADPKMYFHEVKAAWLSFCQAVIAQDKSLEINTRTIEKMKKSGYKDPMPDHNLLKAYLQLGGTKITLGSDSHTVSTVGEYFQATANYLKNIGFTHLTFYVDQRPYKEDL